MFFHLPAMIVQVFDRLLHLRGKEGLKFMVQGDLGSGNVVLKPREGEKPEEKVGFGILEIHKKNTFIFYLWLYLLYSHMRGNDCILKMEVET